MNKTHLGELIRVQIAQDYLKQEYIKLFQLQSYSEKEVIFKKIEGLTPDTMGIRDFWNTVWGAAMGYKLKIGLENIITAQNIEWRLEEQVDVNKLKTGSGLTYIDNSLQGRQSFSDIVEYFKNHQDEKEVWKERFNTPESSVFPIIAEQKEDYYSIHDGNRRFILAALKNIPVIDAYIGEYKDNTGIPANYWVPTPFLMELVYYLKHEENDVLKENYFNVLTNILENNYIARDEFFTRVIDKHNKLYSVFKQHLAE